MTKTIVLIGFVASLLFLSLIAYSFPIFAQGPDSAPGKPEVIAVSGIVPGKDLIVHVWVVVPPGADRNEAAVAALANQGARPFTHDEFTTIALKWDQFSDSNTGNDFVIQYYNPVNDPTVNDPTGNGEDALTSTHASWRNVGPSIFDFQYGGETDRCPSLVKECKGPQTFDGKNDVAWLRLNGPTTLGVTWSGTSIDEADMALNTKFNWATDGVDDADFDVQTVYLHENGHAAGLGHSAEITAIMYPSYQEPNRDLQQDDKDGINFLYPPVSNNASPTVSITSPADGSTVSGTVTITADASDNDGSVTQVEFFVDGASVGVDNDGSNGWLASWDSTTDSDGTHSISAEATDNDANTSLDNVSVTVDNVDDLPSVSITNPNNGSTVSGTVTITADASDDKGVTQVEFFVDGASVGVDNDGSNGWSASWDSTIAADDSAHSISAEATDTIGQTKNDSINVTVNNSSSTSVSVSSIVYTPYGGKDGNKHLDITVTILDNSSNPVSGASVSVDISLEGGSFSSETGITETNGSVTFSLKNSPSGHYETDVTNVVATGFDFVDDFDDDGFDK